MAEGKEARDWWHTASLCATVANGYRKKGKTFTPEDFYPVKQHRRKPDVHGSIEDLKVFVDGRKPKQNQGRGSVHRYYRRPQPVLKRPGQDPEQA